MDNKEGFKTSVEKITVDMLERAWELDPGDVTELLQSHDKTLIVEGLILMDEKREWFFEIESTPSEAPLKIVKMTTKDLGFRIT